MTRFISKATLVVNLPDNFKEYCHSKPELADKIEVNLKLPRSSIFGKMEEIIEENSATMRITEKTQYWKRRYRLDKRLKKYLENGLCENIFQIWRCLLINPSNTSLNYITEISDILIENNNRDDTVSKEPSVTMIFVLASCLDIWHEEGYDASEKSQAILQIYKYFGYENISENHLVKIFAKFNQYKRTKKLSKQKSPLCLVLDHDLHTLPIENTKFLKSKFDVISRIFSLREMINLYMRNEEDEIFEIQDTECFIDPNENLSGTQNRINDWYKQTFKKDNRDCNDMIDALADRKPMLYCGHGGGTSHINRNKMKNEFLKLKGLPMLIGCSSARLMDQGYMHLKSRKTMSYNKTLKFMQLGAPALVGCLWDVTDKDIDLFTMKWINGLMESTNGQKLEEIKNPKNDTSCSNPKFQNQKECALSIDNEVLEQVRKASDVKPANLGKIENPKHNFSKSSSTLNILSDKADEKIIEFENEDEKDNVISPMDATLLEEAKNTCTLKYLNGASLIMYGLPSIQFVHEK